MDPMLFSATGCARCNIVKACMKEKGVDYLEHDIKAEGKDAFKAFYKENRKEVIRTEAGIEFPILVDTNGISQGVGPILARLTAGTVLDSFVGLSSLTGEWISGFSLCPPSLPNPEKFLELLSAVNAKGLKVELTADGRHPDLIEAVLAQGLAHRIEFLLRGPARLYAAFTGAGLSDAELEQSLALLSKTDSRIIVPVAAMDDKDSGPRFLTPEEAGEAAALAARALGAKTHAFFIQPARPEQTLGLDLPEAGAYFKFRTACRRHMVKTDILK